MTAPDPIQVIADLFATDGAQEYLGEPVTQASHMLQAAALAQQCGAPRAGRGRPPARRRPFHLGAVSGHDLMRGTDNRHSDTGAEWLAQWFGPEVTEPVRLHVAAKRYLCAVEPGYSATCPRVGVHAGGAGRPDDAAERRRVRGEP